MGEIDVTKTLQRSTFPLKPDQLVGKAKNVISQMFGTLDNDVLAEDFRFVAPVVGPLVRRRTHAHTLRSYTPELDAVGRARRSFCESLAPSN